MAEYIEREAVNALIEAECSPKVAAFLNRAIDNIPAADVRPVRRGWWVGTHDGFYYSYSCSECGYEALYKENTKDQVCSEFCPNCGADMREIDDEKA